MILTLATEAILVQDPHIRAAVIFGRGRPQNGVIIEPAPKFKFDVDDEVAWEMFIEMIWCVCARQLYAHPS